MSTKRLIVFVFGLILMALGFIGYTSASFADEDRVLVSETFLATPGTPLPEPTAAEPIVVEPTAVEPTTEEGNEPAGGDATQVPPTSALEPTSDPPTPVPPTPVPPTSVPSTLAPSDPVLPNPVLPGPISPIPVLPIPGTPISALPTPALTATATASVVAGDGDGSSVPSKPDSAPTISPFVTIGSHVVRPGETFFCIGRAYQVNPWDIVRFNGFKEGDILPSGKLLMIPNSPRSDITAGKYCVPQFQSPYVPAPAPATSTQTITATPLPTNDDAGNGQETSVEQEMGLENEAAVTAAQNPITETRKIEVNVPKNMILGESLEISLRFNPEDFVDANAASSETTEPTIVITDERERQVSAPTFSDIRHYEDYLLFATARLDAPGFKVASAKEERRLVRAGEEIVYRWSVQPVEAEDQTLIVALWLEYEPKAADMAPLADGMYWNASYKVEVRQTLFGITSSTLETYSTLFGGSGGVMAVVSGVGELLPFWRRKEEEEESASLRPV